MSETWIINESGTISSALSLEQGFTSNGMFFNRIYLIDGIDSCIHYTDDGKKDIQVTNLGADNWSSWVDEAYRTISFDIAATGEMLTWLQANAIKQGGGATMNFKHFYDSGTIGTGTIKFRHYSQTEPLPRLATPTNVTVDGTSVSWDNVENATSYDVYVDGVLYENVGGASGETWVLNETLSGNTGGQKTVGFTSNNTQYSKISYDGSELFYDVLQTYFIIDGWTNDAYRTITFDEPVTDTTLLAWLQANGTKQ